MGAGAVGGYFGGRLDERTDARLTFVARGEHLRALQQKGLRIRSVDGDAELSVHAVKAPSDCSEAPDLILFTVKSYDTGPAIEAIRPVVAAHTQILTIQNGIENYGKLAGAFGSHRVIQGFCKVGAGVTGPGVITHKALGEITAGERDGEPTRRLRALQALFEEADIPVHITPEIDRKVWLKFTWNCIFNMVTAAADVTVDKLFERQETEQICYQLFDEIREVAASEGVTLTEDDGKGIIEPARQLRGFTTSTFQDRRKGKRLEYEAFTGAVVRLADTNGVAVPRNRMLYSLLALIDTAVRR